MAAKRIPDLASLTGAGSVAGDLLLIYDADLDVTKKITRNELAIGLQNDFPAAPVVGTLGAQNADAVNITGGTISGVTISGLAADLAIADGGTGAGTASGARAALGAAASGANSDITSLSGLTTPLSIPQGGTGATSAAAARAALGAAASGANSDITSLSGLTTPLSVAQGGTGTNSLAGLATAIGALGVTAESITANGYVKLTNGLTLQWGKYQPGGNLGENTYGQTFPTPFATNCFIVIATPIAGGDAWVQVQSASITTSGWTARVQAEEPGKNILGWYWLALGN
jgi:hypothetical protein